VRVTLKTPRMTLRPMRPSDGDALHAVWSDAEAMRHWDWPAIKSVTVTRNVIARQCEEAKHGQGLYWAMCLDGQRDPIGACDLSEIDTHHRRAEVGFLVAREYWGRGYALEAMRAVVAYAANALKLERLSARTHSGNDRSARLLERLGFRHEGVLRAFVWREGTRRDCDLYGLLLPRAIEEAHARRRAQPRGKRRKPLNR
jgi:RimJ/RimL family protein N-acetyltransferase